MIQQALAAILLALLLGHAPVALAKGPALPAAAAGRYIQRGTQVRQIQQALGGQGQARFWTVELGPAARQRSFTAMNVLGGEPRSGTIDTRRERTSRGSRLTVKPIWTGGGFRWLK